jgi:hypothetical protein
MTHGAGETVSVRLGTHGGQQLCRLVFEQPREVHALLGWDEGGDFVTDGPHVLRADCACRPERVLSAAFAPRPTYEHLMMGT